METRAVHGSVTGQIWATLKFHFGVFIYSLMTYNTAYGALATSVLASGLRFLSAKGLQEH